MTVEQLRDWVFKAVEEHKKHPLITQAFAIEITRPKDTSDANDFLALQLLREQEISQQTSIDYLVPRETIRAALSVIEDHIHQLIQLNEKDQQPETRKAILASLSFAESVGNCLNEIIRANP